MLNLDMLVPPPPPEEAREVELVHEQNLANFGVVPLTFVHPDDYDAVGAGDVLVATDLRSALRPGEGLTLRVEGRERR